jgi:hypothetical protein
MRPYIFALDRWLCRWQHLCEFTDEPQCLFRIQCIRSNEALKLPDGTCVGPGHRVIALHLWNAHVPRMGGQGPSLGWARRVDRAVGASLRALAAHLAANPALSDVVAICGDMRLSGDEQSAQFLRIAARYGFESIGRQVDRRGMLHRIGDTILIVMLMSATNARALRSAPLRLTNARVWLSRAMLERYLPTY